MRPALFHYYKEPLLITEGKMQVGPTSGWSAACFVYSTTPFTAQSRRAPPGETSAPYCVAIVSYLCRRELRRNVAYPLDLTSRGWVFCVHSIYTIKPGGVTSMCVHVRGRVSVPTPASHQSSCVLDVNECQCQPYRFSRNAGLQEQSPRVARDCPRGFRVALRNRLSEGS